MGVRQSAIGAGDLGTLAARFFEGLPFLREDHTIEVTRAKVQPGIGRMKA
jgi:hypothetical protein